MHPHRRSPCLNFRHSRRRKSSRFQRKRGSCWTGWRKGRLSDGKEFEHRKVRVHHIFYQPETKRRVVVPVHGRDLPTGTLLESLKQAGIEREEIEDLL